MTEPVCPGTMRSPICVVLGHVDHGKTLLLDMIRGSAIQAGEAGGITQAIGASIIPLSTVQEICGPLLSQMKLDFSIPGLLFIDTPGHEAFTNLRRRGGNLADIAVVVVDINEGFKPQTHETIKILREFKTPFVVAANKLDLVPGWQEVEGNLAQKLAGQYETVRERLDNKLYELVAQLSEYGFKSERFDRIGDFTREIAIIPVSAKTGLGVPELLMVITGLAQKFLNQCLVCSVDNPAKGTVLEVKEETGLGTTIDVIIYDGCLNVNDTIVIGGLDKPIVTKVRSLLLPKPLSEMRDKKTKYVQVSMVKAATGVKISAPQLDGVIAGMPLRDAKGTSLEEIQEQVRAEVAEILIETGSDGIVIKADTIGSLEALTSIFKKEQVQIHRALVGPITKKDIMDAAASMDKDPLQGIVLGFNVAPNKEAEELSRDAGVAIITSNIIYQLIDRFKVWREDKSKMTEAKELDSLVRPCKVQIMRGYIFRQRNPAVVGVDVIAGTLVVGMQLMKDESPITTVRGIQHENESIPRAEQSKQVAVSLDNVTVGRHIAEGDVLFSSIPEDDFRKLKEFKQYLRSEERELLKEIAAKMREANPVWGV